MPNAGDVVILRAQFVDLREIPDSEKSNIDCIRRSLKVREAHLFGAEVTLGRYHHIHRRTFDLYFMYSSPNLSCK